MRGECGQASIEVLALVPALVLLMLIAVQVASMLAGASAAQDDARTRALAATGSGGVTTVVTGSATVPTVAGLGWRVPQARVRASVRLP